MNLCDSCYIVSNGYRDNLVHNTFIISPQWLTLPWWLTLTKRYNSLMIHPLPSHLFSLDDSSYLPWFTAYFFSVPLHSYLYHLWWFTPNDSSVLLTYNRHTSPHLDTYAMSHPIPLWLSTTTSSLYGTCIVVDAMLKHLNQRLSLNFTDDSPPQPPPPLQRRRRPHWYLYRHRRHVEATQRLQFNQRLRLPVLHKTPTLQPCPNWGF